MQIKFCVTKGWLIYISVSGWINQFNSLCLCVSFTYANDREVMYQIDCQMIYWNAVEC